MTRMVPMLSMTAPAVSATPEQEVHDVLEISSSAKVIRS
jgi:hypothetical protein